MKFKFRDVMCQPIALSTSQENQIYKYNGKQLLIQNSCF